jgi:ribosomal protein L12E/L44/L45/RPP1/RPP2
MSMTLHVPEDLGSRLAAEAERRGVSIDELSAQLLVAGLDERSVRRHLAFAGIGASGSARGGAQADEMLAEGFGRD